MANVLGINGDKIVSGNTICGVDGTATVSSMGGMQLSATWTVTKTTDKGTAESIQVATNFLSKITNKMAFYYSGGQVYCYYSDFYRANNGLGYSDQNFRKPFDGNNSGVYLRTEVDGTVSACFNTAEYPQTITIYVLA